MTEKWVIERMSEIEKNTNGISEPVRSDVVQQQAALPSDRDSSLSLYKMARGSVNRSRGQGQDSRGSDISSMKRDMSRTILHKTSDEEHDLIKRAEVLQMTWRDSPLGSTSPDRRSGVVNMEKKGSSSISVPVSN